MLRGIDARELHGRLKLPRKIEVKQDNRNGEVGVDTYIIPVRVLPEQLTGKGWIPF